MSRDHRRLSAFQAADALVVDVYRTTVDMPREERYGLQSQVRRAAVSVATNIVEGSARPGEIEYCRFLHVAHASARECAYLIDLTARLDMLPASIAAALVPRYQTVQAMLLKAAQAIENESAKRDAKP